VEIAFLFYLIFYLVGKKNGRGTLLFYIKKGLILMTSDWEWSISEE